MMKKREQVAGYTEAAPVLQHARDALPASVSGVISVVSRTVAVRPAPTSQAMLKLEPYTKPF